MEIIFFIVAVTLGFVATNDDDTNKGSVVESHDKFQNYAPTPNESLVQPVNSYVIYSDKGYVISNANLIPTKKTKWKDSTSQFLLSQKRGAEGQANLAKGQSDDSTNKTSVGCLKGSYKVYFDNDDYTLKPKAVRTISKVIDKANSCHAKIIYISGHATITGTMDHNIQLATKRANAVKNLIEKLTSFKLKVLNPLSGKLTIKPERFAVITLDE